MNPDVGEPDFDGLFDQDYLDFSGTFLTADATEDDVDAVVTLGRMAPDDLVLDAGCGPGRIAGPLADRGFNVIGLDRTSFFARQAAGVLGPRVVLGDFRGLPHPTGTFGVVVCWFTSFGLLDDYGNRLALSEFHRVLVPGGRLLLDVLHRERLVRRLPTTGPLLDRVQLPPELGGGQLVDTTVYDPIASRVSTVREIVRGDRTRVLSYSLRIFGAPDLTDHLLAAGFLSVECFGTLGDPLSVDSPRLVIRATA